MANKFSLYLVEPGPRPAFTSLAHHLWAERDFDSDGNSRHINDSEWTELTLTLRPGHIERVDIDPLSESPLVLVISSSSNELAQRTALFLAERTHGTICSEWPHV